MVYYMVLCVLSLVVIKVLSMSMMGLLGMAFLTVFLPAGAVFFFPFMNSDLSNIITTKSQSITLPPRPKQQTYHPFINLADQKSILLHKYAFNIIRKQLLVARIGVCLSILVIFNIMVTFVCSHCDTTLKKKQAESHSFGRCRPSSFICIDCHVTFQGQDFKAHTSCLTEFEKHWGEYAKQKGKGVPKNQNNGQTNSQPNGQQESIETKKEQSKKSEIQSKSSKIQPAEAEEVEEPASWRGWKIEIKEIAKAEKKVLLQDLQEKVIKRYKQFSPEQDVNDEQLKAMFADKVHKIKKVKVVTHVIYE